MSFNVWFIIFSWPSLRKALGLIEGLRRREAAAGRLAGMTPRINTMLSIQMLYGMWRSRTPVSDRGRLPWVPASRRPSFRHEPSLWFRPRRGIRPPGDVDHDQFVPNCVTLVIAAGAERGQNSLVTIAAGLPSGTEVGLGRRRMSLVLLILGVVAAAAGTATIGFGITINEFTLGTACIIAGTTGLIGGLILIGLSAVVAELGRVGEALRARGGPRPAARPADAAEPVTPTPLSSPRRPRPRWLAVSGHPSKSTFRHLRGLGPKRRWPDPAESYPPPPGPSAVEVSAAAIERLRSSIPRTERPMSGPDRVAGRCGRRRGSAVPQWRGASSGTAVPAVECRGCIVRTSG